LNPLGKRLPFGRCSRFLQTQSAIGQIIFVAHAEVALDRAAAHWARLQLAEARCAYARVAARQQGSGQWVVLAHDAKLFLTSDKAAAAVVQNDSPL